VRAGRVASTPALAAWLAVAAWLPIVIPDPRITRQPLLLGASVFPYCALLGYLTPKLVDRYSQGFPRGGGRAYAVNVVGSILGPLFASYLLLPWLGARVALVVLALPFVALLFLYRSSSALGLPARVAAGGAAILLLVVSLSLSRSFEEGPWYVSQVRRDHTATVISAGSGLDKKLLVNGVGMTLLLPVTKVMAHLPLATLEHEPESALVVALGMGTTFRSLVSWGIDTTAVELVASVRDAFPYYFDDAEALLARPNARIVIDDGRRFLQRVDTRYDVVTLDPAPPVEAVGSSLLYSSDFLELVRQRLRPGGILHHWYPGGEPLIRSAVARSLTRVFPHVRAYTSIEGWGVHFLASDRPFEPPSPEQFVARMPESARRDLVEWNRGELRDPRVFAEEILRREVPVETLLDPDPHVVITDDRPFNEYFLLRRHFDGMWGDGRSGPSLTSVPAGP
jgi:spermidine synthase